MYGLERNIDLNFFIGKELQKLCFSVGQIQLHFEQDISISIEGSDITFNHIDYKDQESNADGHLLHILIGKKIINAYHGAGEGDLVLDFEGDNQLIMHDDSEYYQSYNFWGPNGLHVV